MQCYHILAAKLSLGIENGAQDIKRFNLSQLRKNARAGIEKNSGRKRPRVDDLDVQPAPDAHDLDVQLLPDMKEEQIHDFDELPVFDTKEEPMDDFDRDFLPGATQEQDTQRFENLCL